MVKDLKSFILLQINIKKYKINNTLSTGVSEDYQQVILSFL